MTKYAALTAGFVLAAIYVPMWITICSLPGFLIGLFASPLRKKR